jgi:ubiquinone/menaquinone biosynthesis C-methylase UbiE
MDDMNPPDSNYHGLKASTWDLHRGDTSTWTDRAWYLDIVRRFGQPVLDVGCGTGRILLDFLAQGIDIDGLDNSPEMLDLCRRKAAQLGLSPTIYQHSMEEAELPRQYRTILIPSSSLQLIPDAAIAARSVRRFFDHLETGGALVTAFGFDWREGEELDPGWKLAFEKTRPEDGAIVRRWTHEWRDPQKQLWHEESRYEVELNGKVITTEHTKRSPDGRWYTQAQAAQMFREAGFSRVELFRGFTHEPAAEADRLFCVLAVKG